MNEKEIVAAGGVVMNTDGEILLVHRPRYNDWAFPKGKADGDESIEQTAVREVREETGLVCEIVRGLGEIRYTYRTRKGELKPKVVHYFLMAVTGGALFTDGSETDEAVWCGPETAEKKLSYEGDRIVLRDLVN